MAIVGHLGHFGGFWVILGHFEAFGAILGHFDLCGEVIFLPLFSLRIYLFFTQNIPIFFEALCTMLFYNVKSSYQM